VDGTVVRVRLLQKIKDAEGTLPVCSVRGFFRSGSMILKVRARAMLTAPAIAGSSASVSSPKHRPSGGRAVIEDRREFDLFNLFEFADERAKSL
jgi:hypothetical protein